MQLSILRQNRFVRSLRVMRSGVLLAGVLGFALTAVQSGTAHKTKAAPAPALTTTSAGAPTTSPAPVPTSSAVRASVRTLAPWLFYQRGYYLDNGWLCYGWSNGAYHCTHHWYRNADGTLISTNTKWVPNYGLVPAAPVTHTDPAPQASSYTLPSNSGGSGSVQDEIRAVFGPYAGAALAVAACESGYNPSVYNASSGASGVFQFLRSTWATTSYGGYSPFNAWANIHAAYQIFQRDGYSWREWQCQP